MTNQNIIELHGITKIYGRTKVNDEIDINIKKNSVHGIIGENGAGKSTLMSILFGLVPATTGFIKINGVEENINSPLDAEKLKIGMVQQHFQLVDIFTSVQNIILGNETRLEIPFSSSDKKKRIKTPFINFRKAQKIIEGFLKEYDFHLDINVPVSKLSVEQKQKIEILKILYRDCDILIFDEPTGALGPEEIKGFLKLVKTFKKEGKTVILISHKLEEIKDVCDTVSIIRLGKKIGEDLNPKKISLALMAEKMVGYKLNTIKNTSPVSKTSPVIFEVKHLGNTTSKQSGALKDVSFQIKKGEILAVAGVAGNGQEELVDFISGLKKIEKGEVLFNNKNISHSSIHDRYEMGISHVPADRHKHGLILDWELQNSLFIQQYNVPPFAKNGFLQEEEIYKWSKKIIDKYDVRNAYQGRTFGRALSGGNQQKAIVGREFERSHEFIIAAQPTRGLDVGAIFNIHQQLLAQKKKKCGILLVSYELSEVFALADRILVFYNGSIIGELNPKNSKSQKEIGLLMAGKMQQTKTVRNKTTGRKV